MNHFCAAIYVAAVSSKSANAVEPSRTPAANDFINSVYHKIVHHIHKMNYFVLPRTSSILGHNSALFEDFVKH